MVRTVVGGRGPAPVLREWTEHEESAPVRMVEVISIVAGLAAGAGLLAAAHFTGPVTRIVVAVIVVALVAVRVVAGVRQGGRLVGLSLGLLTVIAVSALAPAFGDDGELQLAAAVVGLGMIPLSAGAAPAVLFSRLHEARRIDIFPALVTSALAGGAGVLVAVGVAGWVDIGDERLTALVPFAATAMASLGLAEVLAHHRIGNRQASSVVAIVAVSVAFWLVLLGDSATTSAESAVTASAIASAALTVGLLVSTGLASPRSLVVASDDVGEGPRFAAVALPLLVVGGAALRAWSVRPLWLDEADTARVTRSSFDAMSDAARAAQAHPPLLDALVWLSRQAFGSDPWALRLPSLIASLVLIPVIHVTASKLFDRRVGLIAAAVVAFGPGFVWLAGQAQPGALAALLTTLSLLALTMALTTNRLTDWLMFGVVTASLLWSHQLALVPVVILDIAAAVVAQRAGARSRRDRMKMLVALAIQLAAFVVLMTYRGGFGPPDVLPPFEYATDGAPAAGRSVFGLVGTALISLVGFHPPHVTSRLLALWPLCMLAAFVLLGRSWSRRGALVVVLAVSPFVALLLLQISGAPRNPPFALAWTATAMPMIAIGAGYAIGHAGRWTSARAFGLAAVALLVVATIDQRTHVEPLPRYDVAAAIDHVDDVAEPGDLVVYAPNDISQLVREAARGAAVVPVADARAALRAGQRVVVIGAFTWRPDDPSVTDALDFVHELSAERPLTAEVGNDEVKVWSFL